MDRGRSFRGVRFAWAAVLALTFTQGCSDERRHHEPGIWFVHATDPHIFLDASIEEDKKEAQEKLDVEAVSDMWQRLPSLENGGRTFSFIVLTGDFGVEPCSIADLPAPAAGAAKESYVAPPAKDCLDKVNPAKRSDQVSKLADLLGKSPVPDIYLVAGNNDIASETADDAGLTYFNHFMDEVQRKIDDANKNVHLHNLTRCYSNSSASTCYADITGTPYRLIGFPSYSYKNRDTSRTTNTGDQEKQFDKFETLLEQARQSGKKVLVVSHVPLIDDPYTLAQQRYGIPIKIDRDPDSPVSQWSTWNVSKKLSEEWQEVIASDTVAGVLAGHLHDPHKEIYKTPYAWSSVNDPRNGFGKLYMAPPLAVKNQDASPIQARGLALVSLEPEHIDYSIYWYNSVTHDFAPDWKGYGSERHRWRRLTTAIRWLWQLADPAESIDRMAVLLIALLAAFLTVVQVWQIPPPDDPLAPSAKTSTDQKNDQKNNGGAKATDARPAFDPSPFASKFGKTVITGLGGLAAETILQSLGGKPTAQDKEFYIVWFILFFFLILFIGALLRAVEEAMRARFAMIYYALPQPSGSRKRGWHIYWPLRFKHWFFSWQVPLLTLVDTFVNLIQGKNQTRTRVFSDTIVEQQRNVIRVANAIRRQLNDVIRLRLSHVRGLMEPVNPEDVRVNISVLSADQSNVFYIARTPGSAVDSFPKRSVAWVSVFAGKIRWYRKTYHDDKALYSKIVLLDNRSRAIADDQDTIYLHASYQPRNDDYEAFVMFPFPWPHRAYGSDYVKGAIHISFRHEDGFDKLWGFPPAVVEDHAAAKHHAPAEQHGAAEQHDDPVTHTQDHEYEHEDRMLSEWCDKQIQPTLREAIIVLGELLRGFNENIYLSSKKEDPSGGS